MKEKFLFFFYKKFHSEISSTTDDLLVRYRARHGEIEKNSSEKRSSLIFSPCFANVLQLARMELFMCGTDKRTSTCSDQVTRDERVGRSVFAEEQPRARRTRERSMRDDKIHHVSVRSIARHPRHLCVPRNWWLSGKKGYITNIETLLGGRMREEGKVDRDKADAIITIFFTRAVFPAGNYTGRSTRRLVAPPPLTRGEGEGGLSFTNRALFPFHSAP